MPNETTVCGACDGTGMTRWLGRDNSEEAGPCDACSAASNTTDAELGFGDFVRAKRLEGVMWVKFVLTGSDISGEHFFLCPHQPRDVFLERGDDEWRAESFAWQDGFLRVNVDKPLPCPACGR